MWKQIKQLVTHSAIYGLGNVATSVISFFLVPLYTHYLSASAFGAYSLLITVYGLMGIVVDCGLTSSIARYYYDENQETGSEQQAVYRRTLISTALLSSLILSSFVAALFYLSASQLARSLLLTADGAHYIRIIAVALFFRGLTPAPLVFLRVTERPLPFTILTVLQLVLFLGLNIILLAYYNRAIEGIFYSLMLSTALYAVLLLIVIRRDLWWRFSFGTARELFRFGLPFLPVLMMIWVIDLSDRYLLGLYASMTEVGIYSLGYKFGQAMTLIVIAFSLGWGPLSFKVLRLERPQAIYSRIATFYLMGAGLAWLTLALWAKEIVALTSPPQFARAAAFIAPVGFAYLIYGLFVVSATGLGVAKKSATLPGVAIGAALLNIGLNIIFIPLIGAMAAAYATIAAYTAMALGTLYCSHRLYPIAYEYRKLAGIFAAMLVLSGLGTLLPAWPLGVMIVLKSLFLLMYVALVVAMGVVSRAEIGKLAQILSRFSPPLLRPYFARFACALQPPTPAGSDVAPS